MFTKEIKLTHFSLLLSLLNLALFHIPFYKFVWANTDTGSLNGIWLICALTLLSIVLNAVVFYLLLYLLRRVGRVIISLLFVINSISLYFINTYQVILDRDMIGNVFNTNYSEASSFFSFSLLLYLILLGILPSVLILKARFTRTSPKKFIAQIGGSLAFLLIFIYANAPNWLWIDQHSTELGAITLPWSYIVNTGRYISHKRHQNKEQIKLPDATLKNHDKAVMVLVIGESARQANFSLYDYERNTNPMLSEVERLKIYKATSVATYTTAGVKAILEHKESNKLYEILPNYLFRTGEIDVIWRTTNWGEPTVSIDKYMTEKELKQYCNGAYCAYDEILLSGLREQILESDKDKVLVVLHMSTSHGPTYYKKYPEPFNHFTPVCTSVELDKCTQSELINAYDNTILYTDYILATLIKELETLEGYHTSMLFVSDHGESLGEKNLYMHGVPMSIAPREQYEIPFLLWASDPSIRWKEEKEVTQHHVFHTVLDLLDVTSPIYNPSKSLLSPSSTNPQKQPTP